MTKQSKILSSNPHPTIRNALCCRRNSTIKLKDELKYRILKSNFYAKLTTETQNFKNFSTQRLNTVIKLESQTKSPNQIELWAISHVNSNNKPHNQNQTQAQTPNSNVNFRCLTFMSNLKEKLKS
jgi:hypothetical protein